MFDDNPTYDVVSTNIGKMLTKSIYTRTYNCLLAKKLSVTKAVIINQIHYWTEKYHDNEHLHEGRYWMYDSYAEWHKQFPELSRKTIQRNLKSLVDDGYVFVGCYNRHEWDKTRWYSLNYEKIAEVLNEENDDFKQKPMDKMSTGDSRPMDKMSTTIPNNTFMSNKTLSIEHLPSNAPLISDLDDYMIHVKEALHDDYDDGIYNDIRYFFEKYEDFTGHPHIMLKLSTIYSIADDLIPYGDCLRDMMIKYFEDKASEEYCGLPHFASERMLRYLAYEVGRPDTVPNRRYIMD